jgi:hypothetical protein
MRPPPFATAALVLTLACGGTGPTGQGNATVASVSVAPDTVRMAPGGVAAFSATLRDADGAVLAGRAITWTVTDAGVADVSAGGVASGVAPGITMVTATAEQRSGQGVVVVEAGGPVSVGDDFERANGALGPNWLDASGNLEIESGEVGMSALGGSSIARWQATAFGPNQFSEAVVGSLDGNTFDFFRGLQVFVRLQTSGTAWRWGLHYFTNMRRYEIKYDGGPTAETRVWATGAAPLPVPGDVLRIEAVGDTIRGFVNGQLTLQVVDPALAGGAAGFVIGLNPGATTLPRGIVASWNGGER